MVWASQVAQRIKNLPALQEIQETQFQSLGREATLEEGMVTHSSILVWRIPWTEEPGGATVCGVKQLHTTKVTSDTWQERSA